jgi:Lon protease-like protein
MLSDPSQRVPLESLPVFPLPNAVLFPDQRMPLHIFEPRYRQMVRDALESRPFIVLSQLEQDSKDDPPRFASIATIGRITAHQRLSDGRFNIVLEGMVRARLEEVPSDKMYRLVRAAPILEPQGDEADAPASDRMALVSLVSRVMQKARERAPDLEFVLPEGVTAARLAFLVADKLLVEGSARQRVLEATDTDTRLRRCAEGVAALLSDIAPRDMSDARRWS